MRTWAGGIKKANLPDAFLVDNDVRVCDLGSANQYVSRLSKCIGPPRACGLLSEPARRLACPISILAIDDGYQDPTCRRNAGEKEGSRLAGRKVHGASRSNRGLTPPVDQVAEALIQRKLREVRIRAGKFVALDGVRQDPRRPS